MRPPLRSAMAGLAGAIAYLAEQEVDRRLMNPRSDDLHLLGGMATARHRVWRPLGLVMHLAAGAAFGLVFDRVVAPRLGGRYWARGMVMAQAENVLLWPLVPILDRIHPAVRCGTLAPLNRPVYFVQAALRHAALGAVMGWLIGRGEGSGPAVGRGGSRLG